MIELFFSFLFLSGNENLPDISYRFPTEGTKPVSAEWPVVIRFSEPIQPSGLQFDLKGDHDRTIPFTVRFSSDFYTVNLLPASDYTDHEKVRVSIADQSGNRESWSFIGSGEKIKLHSPVISESGSYNQPPSVSYSNQNSIRKINGVSVPSDFPGMTINQSGETDSGYVFTNNWSTVGETPYLIIMKNDGTPVYYRRMKEYSRDFKVQRPGLLSYFQPWAFYTMDSTYQDLKMYEPGNGASADEHDFLVRSDNRVLMIAKYYHTVDMSQIVSGGNPQTTILENYIVEQDDSGVTTFLWRSEDHFSITDCNGIGLTANFIDYVHMNSIAFDQDGNLIISSRHLNEVSKIHYPSGQFIWRLGGRNNQFSFTNDVDKFTYQHYAHATGPNRYLLYDNGNLHSVQASRAVEYQLDTTSMTAFKVWYYRHQDLWYSWFMGAAQRLPNGNTLISWGADYLPTVSEVTPAGSVVYQMDFATPAHNYRSFRMKWKGQAKKPYVLGELNETGSNLIFNIFGDKPVNYYRIYSGLQANTLSLLDSTQETSYLVTTLPGNTWYYFAVEGIWQDGTISQRSEPMRMAVKSVVEGENILFNGDFNTETYPWILDSFDGAVATGSVLNEEAFIQIGNGGPNSWSVEFKQTGLFLEASHTYKLEFDAWTNLKRTIEPIVGKAASPWTNYSGIGFIQIGTVKKKYSYTFKMPAFSEPNARLVFACGISSADVFLDNIVLKDITHVSVDDVTSPETFRVLGSYPNPFNPTTSVQVFLPSPGTVKVKIYDSIGKSMYDSDVSFPASGNQTIPITATGWSSGLYVVRLSYHSTHLSVPVILVK